MGIFKSILAKLGFGDNKDEVAQSNAPSGAGPTSASASTSTPATAPANSASPAAPAAISGVDVVAKLEALAQSNPEKLNWKVSIVDLMKLLGMDSSLDARKALATELGCPADKMGDSAQMNMWLHKTVLKKLADNGGNIPANLLD